MKHILIALAEIFYEFLALQRVHITINKDLSIESIVDYNPLVETSVTDQDGGGDLDPAANLTFNLTLSDQEKTARSNLKLPYMHHRFVQK